MTRRRTTQTPTDRPTPVERPIRPDDLYPHLTALQREPFQEVLALCLACRPTEADLRKFSALYPDRWANAISIFARLSGYTEKVEINQNTNITVRVAQMSDSELAAELDRIRALPSLTPEMEAQLDHMAAERAKPVALPQPAAKRRAKRART